MQFKIIFVLFLFLAQGSTQETTTTTATPAETTTTTTTTPTTTETTTSTTTPTTTSAETTTATSEITAAASATSIDYLQSGTNWGGLCTSGKTQSPIDIEVVKGTCDNSMVLDVQFDNRVAEWSLERKQATVEVKGNFSNLYATDVLGNLYGYTALQFHFHAPSEHLIEGKQYDLEMHIVHQLKDEFNNVRDKAVLGILFEVEGGENQPLFDKIKFNELTEKVTLNMTEIMGSQIDENPIYYTYQGSLTTPPCSEIVNWYVLDKVLPITQSQLNAFNAMFKANATFANGNGNNREVVSVGDREVKKGGLVCEEQFVYFFSFFILYVFINYFIFKLL